MLVFIYLFIKLCFISLNCIFIINSFIVFFFEYIIFLKNIGKFKKIVVFL